MIDEVKLTKNDIQEYEAIIFDRYTGRAEREDLILLLLENQKTPHDLKKQLREYANKLDIIFARSGPNWSFKEIAVLSAGQQFKLIEKRTTKEHALAKQENDWWMVQFDNGTEGWVLSEDIEVQP